MVVGRLICALDRPLDAASVSAFRAAFGALMLLSTVRFFGHGWIDEYYLTPTHFFHYWGFSWVRPLPGFGMYAVYASNALAALFITLGFAYRIAALVFAVGFSYAHLCDKANYLNHYYLVSLLACLFIALPLDRQYSLRVLRRPSERREQVRAWVVYLLRFQIGIVYVFGGIGKLGSDWLVHGEPLRIWLAANAGLPILGRLLVAPWAGIAFSWCGALFDLSIVPLLSWSVTRCYGFAVLIAFHVLTAILFRIGMFPWIMIMSATLFFEPEWPRQWLNHWRSSEPKPKPTAIGGRRLAPLPLVAGALYVLTQVLLPLRSVVYPGNTLWTEEGFRFAWKVMLIEKAGALDLKVIDSAGRSYSVAPRQFLTAFQSRMASTQPDMILELAHWVAEDFARRGRGAVRVYADAEVSFNGRQRAPLIDPSLDLSKQRDGLAPKPWILPAPIGAPLF